MRSATLSFALTLGVALPASAASYQFSYSDDGTAVSGVLTTTGTANAQGFYAITGLTGTHGTKAITLLAVGAYLGNDNLVSPPVHMLISLVSPSPPPA